MKHVVKPFPVFIAAIGLLIATIVGVCAAPLTTETSQRIISWNAYSRQFIDAPLFELLPIPGTATYRAIVSQSGKTWTVESQSPQVSLASIWPKLAVKKFALSFEWTDVGGKVIASKAATDRVKAPDFAGFHEPPADWRAAADKGTTYLLHVGRNGDPPYHEPGVPTWIWSAYSACPAAPHGADVGYPCLAIPSLIDAMVACAKAGGPHADEAMQQARAAADWALHNRHPDEGALPLFPYSTIAHGKFAGGLEGGSVNLLRASWFGVGMVELYEADGKRRADYLEYARHIATVTAKFQAADGSFPYRLNPQTGAVVEPYTPAAIEFVRLVDSVAPYGVGDDMLKAQHRALRWMTAYVMATHHWQACFEDVPQILPYANLSQFEAEMTIRSLCRHRGEDPTYLPMAETVNRWIEDQFVVFGPESEAFDHPVKGPLVFEQFACWYPMEVHTGIWINSLLDLHAATGKAEYLDKAKAAGNAICAQQFDDGSFSTFGARCYPDGKLVGVQSGNWYNCNAAAVQALYRLDAYCRTHLPAK
jgi:hypothetical protein